MVQHINQSHAQLGCTNSNFQCNVNDNQCMLEYNLNQAETGLLVHNRI